MKTRHALLTALGMLMVGYGSAEAQTAARVEYRDRNFGIALAIGDLPLRVYAPRAPRAVWTETVWRPARVVRTYHERPSWTQGSLNRGELNRVLGKDMVKHIDRRAKAMGIRGPMQGRWYRTDRQTVMLEVAVRDVPVAEVYDFGGDGTMDRTYFAEGPDYYRDRR